MGAKAVHVQPEDDIYLEMGQTRREVMAARGYEEGNYRDAQRAVPGPDQPVRRVPLR
jgi:hypothetical protein